jgi:GT2 family glycosyltransferase/glycosyltransferase involved in cell wall biosynthesis
MQQQRQFVREVVRKLGLYPLASWILRHARRIKHGPPPIVSAPSVPAPAPQSATAAVEDLPGVYDIICLPVILWNSRFQRPQQMMQQLAERGHRVFYASVGFQPGTAADLKEIRPRVWEMTLPGTPGVSVYQQLPSEADIEKMAAALDALRLERRISSALVIVQLPFWTALAERLRDKFGWPIVYDCMDDHAGFSTNSAAMLQAEERTISSSDLVVVTAEVLRDKVLPKARRSVLIRNACDYAHFSQTGGARSGGRPGPEGQRAKATKPITVGFYGAIAEWFDDALVLDLAQRRPDWRFELIGSTFTGDVARLETLPNVEFLGERPYADLPRLIANWDCFIVPFKRIPLTEATNPVKAYEMLATGKPVVAVDLPELRPMGREGLVRLANNGTEFAEAIDSLLAADRPAEQDRRRAFAAQNTWAVRCDALDQAARGLFSLASIVIVTYNNLALNKACLRSIFERTEYPNYEVIVVDNASNDGTPQWLRETAAREPRLRAICNGENRGFAGGSNQGMRLARGEYLCLLNNDTEVTHGWLSTMIERLRGNARLGMVGPVSNRVGNEAKIDVDYASIDEMPRWAAAYCRDHDGECVPMIMLGFFCVMLPRTVYAEVGELDEQFNLGYFEDTDYCYRVRQAGYELRCARDVFVHHWQGASFRLLGDDTYSRIYRENQQVFEAKWGRDSMAGAY